MRYLILLALLTSCNIDNIARIKNEIIQFCSCRDGVNYAVVGTGLVDFTCNDGTKSKSTGGELEHFSIMGCERE